jgi:hypothetical protein
MPSVKNLLLCIAMLLVSTTIGQSDETADLVIESKTRGSPTNTTVSQGASSDGATNYYSFSGLNGLKLPLSMPSSANFDYTIMFWFRSHQSVDELVHDKGYKAYLFDFPDCCACFIEDGTKFKCTIESEGDDAVDTAFELDVDRLPDIQSWIHFTFSAEW